MKLNLSGILMFILLYSSSLVAAELCDDWNDCITRYRASKNGDERIEILEVALKKWKPELTGEYLEWNKKVLSDEYYIKAMEYYNLYYKNKNLKILEKTVSLYSRALEIKEQPHILYYRGMMYSEKGDFLKAEGDFRRGIEIAPEESYNYAGLVNVSLKFNRTNPPILLLENGVSFLEKKSASEQNDELKKKIKEDLIVLYAQQAKCYLEIQDFKKVLKQSAKAYELDEKSQNYDLCYYTFLAYCNLAKEAFGNSFYDSALDYYHKGLKIRNKNKDVMKITEPDTGWDYYLNLIGRRAKLGNIKPRNIHKVLNIYVRNINVLLSEKSGLPVKSSIDLSMKNQLDTDRKVSIQLIELFSKGEWTLESSDIIFDGTVTEITRDYYAPLQRELRYPVLEKIEPQMEFRNLIKDNMDKYDTIIIYFPGKGIATAAGGGGRQFPLPAGDMSAFRGWIAFPVDYVWEGEFLPHRGYHLNGWLHEFFHVIQYKTCLNQNGCIGEIHEYMDQYRKKVPGWKGKGELNYYEWRFSETLPKIGWENLGYR